VRKAAGPKRKGAAFGDVWDRRVETDSTTSASSSARLDGEPQEVGCETFEEIGSGRRVHVIEAGQGEPVVLLHGSATSSLLPLPLLERLAGVRGIAVDRPGFGSVTAPTCRGKDCAPQWSSGWTTCSTHWLFPRRR
jgi:pimeloyl-ACP methyl ester carboxylesterase